MDSTEQQVVLLELNHRRPLQIRDTMDIKHRVAVPAHSPFRRTLIMAMVTHRVVLVVLPVLNHSRNLVTNHTTVITMVRVFLNMVREVLNMVPVDNISSSTKDKAVTGKDMVCA